jgi:hypothetical protein
MELAVEAVVAPEAVVGLGALELDGQGEIVTKIV